MPVENLAAGAPLQLFGLVFKWLRMAQRGWGSRSVGVLSQQGVNAVLPAARTKVSTSDKVEHTELGLDGAARNTGLVWVTSLLVVTFVIILAISVVSQGFGRGSASALSSGPPSLSTPSGAVRSAAGDSADFAESSITVPSYRIVAKERIPAGSPRLYYHVVVHEQVDHPQLAAVIEEVREDALAEAPRGMLSIWLYDHEHYIGYGYTLGKADFLVDGDTRDAGQANVAAASGVLSTIELKVIDWSNRLTPLEVRIWRLWHEEYDARDRRLDSESMGTVDEDLLSQDIADQFQITANEVQAILEKDAMWRLPKSVTVPTDDLSSGPGL